MSEKRLDGRVALITGASRGIGRAVARRFAEEGAHVIAVARTQGALEELDDEIEALGGSCTLSPLDLKDFEKIDQMGTAIHDRWGKLDILVGNAGMLGDLTPIHQMEPKMWHEVMGVNVTVNYRLIRSMHPLLRESDAGRAIFVTSTVGHEARAYWSAYAISKAALEMMVRIYADEQEKTPIKANLINPGATRTRMRAAAMPGEDPETLPGPEEITETFVRCAEPACPWSGEVIDARK